MRMEVSFRCLPPCVCVFRSFRPVALVLKGLVWSSLGPLAFRGRLVVHVWWFLPLFLTRDVVENPAERRVDLTCVVQVKGKVEAAHWTGVCVNKIVSFSASIHMFPVHF